MARPAGLPRRLRIGHLAYRVRVDRQRCEDEESEAVSSGNLAQILVRGDRPHLCEAESLLHEVLHQALFVAGVDNRDDARVEEERLVRAMTGPLLGALRDNPDLVAYLLR